MRRQHLRVRSPLAALAMTCAVGCLAASLAVEAAEPAPADIFAADNLVAWCIVPFDAQHRGPEERAAMLDRLGLKRVAYDWRAEHVATFEEEIHAYQRHGLEFLAFWSWHPEFAPLVKQHDIHPQFWITNPSPDGANDDERAAKAAEQLLPIVRQAAELDCQVGLYNHGGWGGEPANLVAVCERLRDTHDARNVGIVYNFHHGHDHITDFADSLKLMLPMLLCVNINGMNDRAEPKILTLGEGRHEIDMLRTLKASGYVGPIGILDHRPETDSEETLRENLAGLRGIADRLAE
ncbi:MAG: TIM barrel protein [Planctomycetaceae bacterium]